MAKHIRRGKPMAKRIRHGNATRSAIRACLEHVFGYEKGPMALTIRSIGQTRAAGRMTLANLNDTFRTPHLPRATTGHGLNLSKSLKSPACAAQNGLKAPRNRTPCKNPRSANINRVLSHQYNTKNDVARGGQLLAPMSSARRWA